MFVAPVPKQKLFQYQIIKESCHNNILKLDVHVDHDLKKRKKKRTRCGNEYSVDDHSVNFVCFTLKKSKSSQEMKMFSKVKKAIS